MIKIKEWWKRTWLYGLWTIIANKEVELVKDLSSGTYYVKIESVEKEETSWLKEREKEVEENWNKVKQQLNNNKMDGTNQVDPESVYPKPEPGSILVSTNSTISNSSLGDDKAPTKLESVLSLVLQHNTNLVSKISSVEETAKKLDPTYSTILTTPKVVEEGLGILDKITNYLQMAEGLAEDLESVSSFIKKQI